MVCVLGPTASGKTRYAVQLARALGSAEIISADSRQVYRRMDIGTGKDLSEYGPVPYHLIDIAEPGTQYNVYRFREDFAAAMEDIRSRGAFPILCGGTGLYISAVTSGYDFASKKPLSARLDSQPDKVFFIGTLVSREVRNARIDARLDARMQEGMIQEIKGLLDEGIDPQVLISYGLEYKFVTQYLIGELDYATMRERLAIAIHQFAKRQMTWFRGMERSGIRIHWTEV
ncbi:MAG: tRNA (adenosine(37)-N6)-dimethylallyltransferase MiaA [Bacteroidales bacterium]|nr:tRNA (adenosine(37)-N6)-dimethylallyltransferase MiaA [Bacteroidales bacterium]